MPNMRDTSTAMPRTRHKICHITTVHKATDVRIYQKELLTIASAGYDTFLIAPADEDSKLIDVTLLPLPKFKNRAKRFFLSVLLALTQAKKVNAELYHFHDPELIFAALMLKLYGKRVIWDVHEDLPKQIMNKQWIPRWLRPFLARLFDFIERNIARLFDAVIAATADIANKFTSARRVVIIQNFPKMSEMVQVEGTPYKTRPPLFVYVGGLSEIRGVKDIVLALEYLPKNSNAQLALAGRFEPPRLLQDVSKLPGWSRVRYLGWLDRKGVVQLLNKARAGLVMLHPTPNYINSLPIKMFEYMAAGVPVIASDFPLWREILMRERAGLLVNPKDPKAIAEAMSWILEHPDEAEAMGEGSESRAGAV